jgi:dTDP-4-dehydrorhamnose reductase
MAILLTGSSGFLGTYVKSFLEATGEQFFTLRCSPGRSPDGCDKHFAPNGNPEDLLRAFDAIPLSRVIHVAAMASASHCEKHPSDAWDANVRLTRSLVRLSREKLAHFTYISTDLVYDGATFSGRLIDESVPACPSSVYGRTKFLGEEEARLAPECSIVRASLLYGKNLSPDSHNVLDWIEGAFRAQSPLILFNDEFRTPIHVSDAAQSISVISRRRATGIWHCGGPQRLSRVEFGTLIAESRGYDTACIVAKRRAEVESSPARPEDVSLDSRKLYRETGKARTVTDALSDETA